MSTPTLDDRALFALVADGTQDPQVWRRFVDRFSKLCYHAIHRVIARHAQLDTHDVEEVFQRLFVRLLERDRILLTRYRGENGCSPGTYLSHLAAYQALEYVRVKHRRSKVMMLAKEPISTSSDEAQMSPTPEEELQVSQETHRVRSVLNNLRPSDKLLYDLHYEQGLSMVDIARMLNRTETAVHVQHHRLKERMRILLERSDDAHAAG